MIRRSLDALYLMTGYAGGLFLIAIFFLMMSLSVGREIGINVKSGDDIAAWCMAALGFMPLAHTFKKGELIRMGLVIDKARGWTRRLMEIGSLAIASALLGYFAWHVGMMTYESWLLNDLSSGALVVPLWIPQLGVAIGAAVLFIAVVDELVMVAMGRAPSYDKPPPTTKEEILKRAQEGSL